ncbi:MAG TPA: HAD family hydrolase [Candidatus Dormibacteraeota bacterium]|nr:HAD family hydrolase [Candidatus Dormibacteraeota bacterium]
MGESIEVDVPGWKRLRLTTLVLDVNGTIALDGELLPEVQDRLQALRSRLDVHLLSADTYGQLSQISVQLGVAGRRLDPGNESEQKASFVEQLGPSGVVAVGNGMNDVGMLKAADLSIAVIGHEGLAIPALLASDIVAGSIGEALDLLLQPRRLVASLRR